MSSAREAARRALARVEKRDEFLRDALGAELKAASLSAADRGLATEIAYGVLRHRSRIDRALEERASRGTAKLSPAVRTALRVAAYQILFLQRVPTHAAVNDAVDAVKRTAGPKVGGFANGLLRALAREGETPIVGDDRAAIALRESLPPWIVEELAARVGDQGVAEAAAAMTASAEVFLRINGARIAVEEAAVRLASEVPRAEVRPVEACPGALATTGLGNPAALQSFAEGLWTVQDIGAQWVASMVSPSARSILDGCAGVGGKALQLAGRSGVTVLALDPSTKRLSLLEEARRRLGVAPIETRGLPLAEGPTGPFDAVLVDAPCTGLGVLRRHPERKWRGGPEDVAELASIQRGLLRAAAERVRVGGELVYAVCTFTRAEGPDQIADFLAAHPGFRIEAPTPVDGGPPWDRLLAGDGSLTTWPHVHGADAFYAVRLVRES